VDNPIFTWPTILGLCTIHNSHIWPTTVAHEVRHLLYSSNSIRSIIRTDSTNIRALEKAREDTEYSTWQKINTAWVKESLGWVEWQVRLGVSFSAYSGGVGSNFLCQVWTQNVLLFQRRFLVPNSRRFNAGIPVDIVASRFWCWNTSTTVLAITWNSRATIRGRSFSAAVTTVWNSLPEEIRSSSSLTQFRTELQKRFWG